MAESSLLKSSTVDVHMNVWYEGSYYYNTRTHQIKFLNKSFYLFLYSCIHTLIYFYSLYYTLRMTFTFTLRGI